jgi:phosphopantothenoylcysteine synthetase/decarboxylase
VQVVMTRTAEQFLTAYAAEVFSGQPVGTSSELPKPNAWQGHIRLAREASILLVAPATANMIARLATGLAEDLVSTVTLAATCPKVIAPAMNIRMLENATTQRNLRELRERGFYIIEPVVGIEVATMEVSYGSMPQPREIAHFLFNVMAANAGVIRPATEQLMGCAIHAQPCIQPPE